MATLINTPFELDADDEYDKICGQVLTTIKGNIIFHCNLCENKFKECQEYVCHINEAHFESYICLFDEQCDEDLLDADQTQSSIEGEPNYKVVIETIEEEHEILEDKIYYEENEISAQSNESEEEIHDNKLFNMPKKTVQKNSTSKERQFKCTICGFAFTQLFNLRAHMRRHTNEKKHKCSKCPKSFHTRTELETHKRRHDGTRPFICEECGQTFVTAGSLTIHVKRHKNIRNHQCNICSKKFFDGYALKLHLVAHTGERPHVCDQCKASFSRKKALSAHRKIHENKREYQCQYCNSSFNQKPGLYSHIKIKHSGKS